MDPRQSDHPGRARSFTVSTEMPEAVPELMSLYPQPVRSVPTVEYLPAPPRPPARNGR